MIKNDSFTEDFKVNFETLINKLIDYLKDHYQDIDLTKWLSDLQKLRITDNSSLNDSLISYNSIMHELKIKSGRVEDNVDIQYLVAIQLLTIFNSNPNYRAVILGMAAEAAGHAVGNIGEINPYEDEQVITKLLASTLGNDTIIRLCFNNDEGLLRSSLAEKGITEQEFSELMVLANYNFTSRENFKSSNLAQLQNMLIEFFGRTPRSNNEVQRFETDLVSNPAMLIQGIDYGQLPTVIDNFVATKGGITPINSINKAL